MKYEVRILEHNYYTIEVDASGSHEAWGKALDEFNNGVWPDSTATECFGIALLDDPGAEYYEANLIDNDAFDEPTDEEFELVLFGGK